MYINTSRVDHYTDSKRQSCLPSDNRDLVPLLPIPNRQVKRILADDSLGVTHAKVGHR